MDDHLSDGGHLSIDLKWSHADALLFSHDATALTSRTDLGVLLCKVRLPSAIIYYPHLRCVHSPLQLRCGKLQWSYFRLCADYCITVLRGCELEVQCVALSCGSNRYIGNAAALQQTMNATLHKSY